MKDLKHNINICVGQLDMKHVQIICGIAILSSNISAFCTAVLKRESYPWSLVQAVQDFVHPASHFSTFSFQQPEKFVRRATETKQKESF